MSMWTPLVVELRESGVLVQKTIQRTENGPIEILYPPQVGHGDCQACNDRGCTAMQGCVAISNPPAGEDIQIDEWNGLTDKLKVELVRAAPKLTVLELIELVEEELRIKNK